MKEHSAAIGPSFVQAAFAMSALLWAQMTMHFEVNRWIVGITWLVLYALNDYFLVWRGRGMAFEKQFRNFGAGKRSALYIAAIIIVLASGFTCYFAGVTHRQYLDLAQG